jgi:hypothetical protein
VVACFSAVVALGLVIAKGGDWVLQFIYAEAIGLSIWACTDFGRLLFKLDPESNWPTGWRMIVMQVSAVIVGYVIGTSIGDLYCGCSTFELWQRSPRTFAGYFVLCVAVTVAICFFFLTRGRDQRRLRQIATAQRDALRGAIEAARIAARAAHAVQHARQPARADRHRPAAGAKRCSTS